MLPPAIASYFEGADAHDADRASSLFAEDAIVHDDHKEHVGRAAIRGWVQSDCDRYAMRLAVEDIAGSSDATVVLARVSGTFPGSPIMLRFAFQLANGLIARLDVTPG